MPASWYRWQDDALILTVRVQPRASRDEIAGLLGDALKIRLTAPPVDGKANQRLIHFLAQLFGVTSGDVTLLSGQTGRNKHVRICNPKYLPGGIERPGL